MKLPFETMAVETKETIDTALSIEDNVTRIALEKAEAAMLPSSGAWPECHYSHRRYGRNERKPNSGKTGRIR